MFSSVALEGNALSIAFTSTNFGPVTIAGVITGAEFEGTTEVGPLGSLPFTATRRPE